MQMIVGILQESHPGERRVAIVPRDVLALRETGIDVFVEEGAGVKANFLDSDYESVGARVVSKRDEVFSVANVLLTMHSIGNTSDQMNSDFDMLQAGQVLVGLLDPFGNPKAVRELADKGIMSFALELLPRITRAQPMDVLSSMATVAGYKGALMAADLLPRMYPMMITAAGTITPAKVLVLGAGVAGLVAIATSRRFGAVVQAYDIRPAVREQVVSLGAKFLDIELTIADTETSSGYARDMGTDFYLRQRDLMKQAVVESDVVIATAAVPGGKAPVLITGDMVEGMRSGSVVVDLAAGSGGNCELTKAEERLSVGGVTIVGPTNLPSSIPYHASQLYSRNNAAFLRNMVDEGEFAFNMEDQILRDTLLTQDGEVKNVRVLERLEGESEGNI